MPNFTFYGRRRQATKFFFFFVNYNVIVLRNSILGESVTLFHTIADGYGVNVVVNFLSQVFFFPLFLDMVMCANEFETKEKQKLPEIN